MRKRDEKTPAADLRYRLKELVAKCNANIILVIVISVRRLRGRTIAIHVTSLAGVGQVGGEEVTEVK